MVVCTNDSSSRGRQYWCKGLSGYLLDGRSHYSGADKCITNCGQYSNTWLTIKLKIKSKYGLQSIVP